jgi:hypothetical protein
MLLTLIGNDKTKASGSFISTLLEQPMEKEAINNSEINLIFIIKLI